MVSTTLQSLLDSCTGPEPHFPPTLLFNEGWMLRLALDWFASHAVHGHPLAFPDGGTWFSEGHLPSPFLSRSRKDPLGESRTRADGVIGHVQIGKRGKADLEPQSGATHFVVCEAKLFSGLSSNVKNAVGYDQAARNIACMVEVLRRSGVQPSHWNHLGFYVLAPKSRIEAGVFVAALDRDGIQKKIAARALAYEGEQNSWLNEWFMPTFPQIAIQAIAWEEIVQVICSCDPAYGGELQAFYECCLRYNYSEPKSIKMPGIKK
jgi:hypothetical protein